jgi:hypothetical protein
MGRLPLYTIGIESNLYASFDTLSMHSWYYTILTGEPAEYSAGDVRQQQLRQRYTGLEALRISGVELFCVGLRRHLGLSLESCWCGKRYRRLCVQVWQGDCFSCRV